MDVVDKIVNSPRDRRDNPVSRIEINAITTKYSLEDKQNTNEISRLAQERKLLKEERKKHKTRQNLKEAERLARERKLLEEERKKLEALRLAEEKRQRRAQAEKEPPPRKEQTPQSGTGSGFFVSKMGHVITNAHVVQNCKKVTIGDNANKQVPAELINTDRSNDLALLKLSTLEMASAESQSLIQKLGIVVVPLASKGLLRSEDVRLGEKVLVAGYPFGEFFSNTIKVTTGVVSATRGAGDDSGQFQLDAAVQPGNSGGPIYDSGGNIVGVVISQLDKLKVAKAIGSLPENVNFGIKASTVRQFLTSSGLPSKKSERTEEKSTEQLAEIAQNQALMVMCLQ
jgi:S1-C subfamily serine protease